jgi:hypothetical protein
MKDLFLYRGDTKHYPLTFTDSNNAPIDITGWTVFFTVKTNLSDADLSAVLQKTITTHTAPTSGQTQIDLSSTDTDALNGDYYYDIQIKTVSGDITTVLSGSFKVAPDVTRRTS